ncbi:NAD(P)-dependent oxidoreductase [Peribacillus muralis]|uniref:NAD(P)-dependent oxidoreductase n=1 Tax=Peribacillus muralis TaxID=264697 RepID=UPI001F4EA65C|nr:NAD(P)-dependent oxidoreductase [Peribacillus muralis]MCK1995057.1 NAD(P)-dependent oxidoreductase [Peribacillus muralis]MCK2015572.1 NAD(P)-dependent oxidoreductase [Peribacillus muralis]
MKIGIIGASGKVGNLILREAKDRGFDVTAIVRNASRITEPNVNVIEKDIFALTGSDLTAFDVVVNTYKAPEGEEHLYVDAGRIMIKALQDAPNTKLIVVGGAGSLFVDEDKTKRLMDTPDFPDFVYPTASNAAKQLEELQQANSITWTYISPAGFFDPEGKKTGSYQSGKDHVILNAKGQSYISYADYAIAVVDEIEKPQHVNERFTLVGEAE